MEISLPVIHCTVKTGRALELDEQTYGNYRVTVTVMLRNSGVAYLFTQAPNFVIYTNAKIIPTYVDQP